VVSPSRADWDYTEARALEHLLRRERPEFLINAAGYTGKPNVDACESDRAACLNGNAVLPGSIAMVCEALGIPWGHVSSGCIFSGRRADGAGFTEEDVPNFAFRTNNCSFYSGTKALGEEVLGYREVATPEGAKWQHSGSPSGYIWRLRIPFDEVDSPRNYLTKLLRYERLLEAENSISHLGEFVAACFACFEQQVAYGIYNVTNPGAVTTRQVVGWMREESARRQASGMDDPFAREFKFFENLEDFMQKAAITPRSNCVLDTAKLTAAGIYLRPVEEAVRTALREWQAEEVCHA
ncbi:MAG: sugar nucleotide-binding protein, partial [Verrucomicrobiota bacterium]